VLFAQKGFSATSVKEIAALAGVDPALVIRHFGTKEALFLRTMAVDEGLRDLVGGPLPTLGRSLLQRIVEDLGDETRGLYTALLGALDRPEAQVYFARSTERHIVSPLAERLSGADRRLRAELVAVQVHGLLVALWVARDPALTARPLSEVLDTYARGLQVWIDGAPGPAR
jgi:AcrR family transcriptional regulator